MDVVTYDDKQFPWSRVIALALSTGQDLDRVRTTRTEVAERQSDQATHYHRLFYDRWTGDGAAGNVLRRLYKSFLQEEVLKHVKAKGPFAYQAIPTFRICEPGNVAVGEWHTDSHYGHPDGEINFWLPLTDAFDTNSLWVANYAEAIEVHRSYGRKHDAIGRMEVINGRSTYVGSVTAEPGEMFVFDAVNTYHGNVINETDKTRVSIDFRVIPVSKLPKEPQRSVNTGTLFALGGYYAKELLP